MYAYREGGYQKFGPIFKNICIQNPIFLHASRTHLQYLTIWTLSIHKNFFSNVLRAHFTATVNLETKLKSLLQYLSTDAN